ncbi:MAG TPA: pantoate--beta-alanine ligase [Acidobacteriota bacterium]|jgi:pantoate--beta-alanine ligase|nr:pantoate--beta-alanine ligase [Acidobacteriota bacterium]HNR37773.1 pantoate--beta-alanine ligase [Acidobacteriota bacterium]HNT99230.1 pantoate--beta-alanine ligase [Acidobacteriota bacterium]
MELITKINKLKAVVRKARAAGSRIGFVPTMGALHEGHLSLVKKARECADVVVVSIFVNPLQFSPTEDFTKYPRNLSHDVELLTRYKVDFVFAPAPDEFYAKDFETRIEVDDLSGKLCGQYRPGHFAGVTTVVAKLFTLVEPQFAFFGQKDAQQAIIIRRMVADLKFPVEVNICPIVREADGLAMSSRNVYLKPDQRRAAPILYRSLRRAAALVLADERRVEMIRRAIEETLATEPLAKPQYVAIVDTNRLEPVSVVSENTLIALAVHIGDTRLIDNILVSAPS